MFRRSIDLLLVVVFVVGVLALGGCEGSDQVSSTVQPADITTTESSVATVGLSLWEDGWLLGVPLGADSDGWTVSEVIEKLGEPDRVQLPDLAEDPSPIGQWFRWDLGNGEFTFSLLAGAYDDEMPDYGAPSYLSALRRNDGAVSEVVTEGLSLGGATKADVEMLFADTLLVSGMAERWNIDETGAAVSCLFREEEGVYTYYFFDTDDVLVGIAQATGNLDGMD